MRNIDNIPFSEKRYAIEHARRLVKNFGVDPDGYDYWFLVRKFAGWELTLDYTDRYRLANVRDPQAVKVYMETRDKGCCGSADDLVNLGDNLWLIGCNYGH